MPVGEGKVTLSAAVPIELKERIQRIASQKRWTLSQTLVIFLEEYLAQWEKDITDMTPSTERETTKSVS